VLLIFSPLVGANRRSALAVDVLAVLAYRYGLEEQDIEPPLEQNGEAGFCLPARAGSARPAAEPHPGGPGKPGAATHQAGAGSQRR